MMEPTSSSTAESHALFAGPGEMRMRCRELDWSATALGPVEQWPPTLRTLAPLVLATGVPSMLFWGAELVAIYNDAFVPLIGAQHPEVLGRQLFDAAPATRLAMEPLLARVLAGETITVADAPTAFNRRGDDVPTGVNVYTISFAPVRDDRARVLGVYGMVVETTAQRELRASETRLQLALDVAELGTWEIDLETGMAMLDRRGAEIVGLETTVGSAAQWQSDRVHPDDLPRLQADVAAGIAAGEPFDMSYRVVLADGRVRHVASRGRVMTDTGGRPVRLVGTNRDVTAEREVEAERARLFEAERSARRDAEAANRAKGEFLAVMSHELRTPLNAIGGYAELLELGIRGPVTEQQRADLARIRASQRHLLGLINQVLNYTRVDAGVLAYDLTDVPVAGAIAAAEALVLPQLRSRGLAYHPDLVPRWFAARADPEKLQQILLNLLGNAVKFTQPGGEIRVRCSATPRSVSIAVEDTGIGIAAERLTSIFEPFVQVNQGLTRSHDGVGLGLAISRELARGMRGDLSVESAVGKGSVFTLTLPAARDDS